MEKNNKKNVFTFDLLTDNIFVKYTQNMRIQMWLNCIMCSGIICHSLKEIEHLEVLKSKDVTCALCIQSIYDYHNTEEYELDIRQKSPEFKNSIRFDTKAVVMYKSRLEYNEFLDNNEHEIQVFKLVRKIKVITKNPVVDNGIEERFNTINKQKK